MIERSRQSELVLPKSPLIRVVCSSKDRSSVLLNTQDGKQVELSLKSEDIDEALALLRRLNQCTFADGQRLSSFVTVDGFEPWWFVQDHLFWHILVPFTRYRSLIDQIVQCSKVTVVDVPPDLRYLLDLLHGLPGTPTLSFEQSSPTGKRGTRHLFVLAIEILKLLVSVLALLWFRLARRDVLLYTIDKVSPGLRHDFRIDGIYREICSRGYRYGEYVHSADTKETLRNLFRRHRWAIFFETVTSAAYRVYRLIARPELLALPAPDVDPAEPSSLFLASVARHGLICSQRSAFALRCLKYLVRFHSPKVAVILDDSRYANELVAACKQLGVFVVGYQHGALSFQYHPGLMAYGFGSARKHTYDAYGLWSDYFRQSLLQSSRLYDDTNTFVSGPLRPPTVAQLRAAEGSEKQEPGPIRVLVVAEVWKWASQSQFASYVERLVEDDRLAGVVRIRPGWEREGSGTIWSRLADRVRFHLQGSVYEAFGEADVVLGTYSSALSEAILALKPVVIVATTFTYGHHLVRAGLAEWAASPDGVVEVVQRAATISLADRRARRNALWGDGLRNGAELILDQAQQRMHRC